MTDFLLIHFVILAWLSLGAAYRWTDRAADTLLAAGALAWANLLTTALILSAFARLHSVLALAGVSLGLAGLALLAAWRFPSVVGTHDEAGAPHPTLLLLLTGTLGLLAAAGALVAASYAPLDPAALGQALPDAYRLLTDGRLFSGNSSQVIIAPNHTVLHAWVLAYHPLLPTLNFINASGWVLAGVAVFQCARTAGLGVNAALAACTGALAALPVLAQAATLDHQLLGAAALVASFGFAGDWLRRRRPASALFSGLLSGLAAGCGPALLLTVLVAAAFAIRRLRREHGARLFLPGLLLGLLPPLLGLSLSAANPAGLLAALSATVAAPAYPSSFPFLEGASFLDESSVGPGLTGFLCLGAALFGLLRARDRDVTLTGTAGLAAGWLVAAGLSRLWLPPDSRLLVPALLFAAPSLAAWLDRAAMLPRFWSATAILIAAASLWSAHSYFWHNAWRPLDLLLDRNNPVRQPPDLRAALERPPGKASRIQFSTDRGDGLLLGPGIYHIVSRSSYAESRALQELRSGSASLLIPFLGKATPGVAFLGRVGFGASARDYLGVPGTPAGLTADGNHNTVLVTVADASRPGSPPELRLELLGLHAQDGARLEVIAESTDGRQEQLAAFADSGSLTVPRTSDLSRLRLRLITTADGVERGTAELNNQSAIRAASTAAKDPRQAFFAELVSLKDPAPVRVDARLLPPEGPFPQLKLPQIRWMRAPTITLRVPASAGISRWRLSASTRLQLRPEGIMEIVCNGQSVRRIKFDDPATWQEIDVEFPAIAGENVVEIRDLPLPPGPDWLEYLERYPDVHRYLELTRRPLIGGAREHYESSGKAEGRTVVLVDQPRPASDAFYYLFRSLRVEGLKL